LADIRYYQYDFEMRRQDWRAVTSYVFEHAQLGDSIFFYIPAARRPSPTTADAEFRFIETEDFERALAEDL